MNATINQTIIHLGNANEYILGSNEFWESMDTIFFIGMPLFIFILIILYMLKKNGN